MANIAFPPTPANNQLYSQGGRTWKYVTAGNKWLVVAETTGILTTADRIDEDDMVSDSATKVPTQQSVRAYVTNNLVTGAVSSVNALTGAVVLNPDHLSDSATLNKFVTAAQKTAIDGAAPVAQSINAQTGASYQLVAGDAGKLVALWPSAAMDLVVPQDSAATIAIGTYVDLYVYGVGQVTVVAGTGATVRVPVGLTAKSRAQYAAFGLQKVATNTWRLFGDLEAV